MKDNAKNKANRETVITAKRFKYYHLRPADVRADICEAALHAKTAPARQALDGAEIEEHEDFAGTYFVNVYVENRAQAKAVTRALRESCANVGHGFDTCATFGEFEPEKHGPNAGRVLVYFYIFDRDFPGCQYEESDR